MSTRANDSKPVRLAWTLPLAFSVIGAWSWACQDTGPANDSAETGDASDTSPTGDPSDSGQSTGGDTVDRRAVLDSIAHQVIVVATQQFAEQAVALQSTTATLSAAPNPAQAADELAAAQQAFGDAMTQLQQLEVMQIGPAAVGKFPGGELLRDEIYSWPLADTCTIDMKIADESFAEPGFFLTALPFAYGLDALEYLLFVHDAGHSCGVSLDAPWMALGFEEIERRRARYAAAAAAELVTQSQLLATRWSPGGDDFAALLANPGEGDSPFESDVVALDDVFRAMFYIDLLTKDRKLGQPLGIIEGQGCDTPPCHEQLELPYSGMAADAVAANLAGLKEMIHGGPDPATADGFDDLLIQAGHPEIVDTLIADIDAAIAECEAFEDPLQTVILTDTARVEALHGAVKRVTDTLKGPFVMALMLTVPMEGAGDAD